MRICLDFDGVLHQPGSAPPGHKMGVPVSGAVSACWAFQRAGDIVIVHTARAQREEDAAHVQRWLAYFDFPVMPVVVAKPLADVYLDDRAVRFVAWPEAMAELRQIDFSR